MSKFILFISVVILMIGCKSDYEKVINDFSLHSYYLVVKVSTDNNIMEIAIENEVLYSLFNKNISMSKTNYKKMISNALKKNTPIKVDKDFFRDLEYYVVAEDKAIKKINQNGIEILKETFFTDGVLYKRLTYSETKFLIYCLFKNNLYVKVDDESGFLILE
ncbi:MAG: hypothetical protein N4A72_20195 [Bacteroidales bacterium]|jgi:hypothetical protein|nr:hypothetical protein [Bacteroidales bacterium]